VLAVRQVTPAIGIQAGRVMRRWYRAKRLTKQITVERVDRATGRVYVRRSRIRKRLFAHNRGFAAVNGGPAFDSQLARYFY
jgi:ribosomal protein S17